jgi:tripartite-type tricarboxylate transporter receptor subunit TctC
MNRFISRPFAAGAALLAFAIALPAAADPVADFYKGRTVTVAIPAGPVGGYAIYARLAVEFMPRFIPGHPNMVFQAMPGGGGTKASNYTYNAAPKDGSYLLAIVQTVAMDDAMKAPGMKYEARKFNYIGRFADSTPVTACSAAAGVTSYDVIRSRQVITGGTGPASPTDITPKLLDRYAGAKFKLVTGYKDPGDIALALERGEVECMTGSWVNYKTGMAAQLRERKIIPLIQFATRRHPDLPNVPTVVDLAQGAEGKAVAKFLASGSDLGRSLAAPPGVPAERLAALRAAFQAMVKDKAFLAETTKRRFDINPATGEELATLVDETLATPPDIVAKAAAIVRSGARGGGDKKGKK